MHLLDIRTKKWQKWKFPNTNECTIDIHCQQDLIDIMQKFLGWLD